MEYKETNTFPQEPGVKRNQQGRIIATGWPITPKSLYPQTCTELGEEIQKQIRIKENVI